MELSELLKALNLTDLKATDKDGNTALHLTVKKEIFTREETIEILEILLDRGVDPNAKNFYDETVLQIAVRRRLKDVINFFIARGVNKDLIAHFFIEDEYTKFRHLTTQDYADEFISEMQRMENESANFVEWLIARRFDFYSKNGETKSAFHLVIEYNLQHVLLALLKYCEDVKFVDEQNRTLLHLFLRKYYSAIQDETLHSISNDWYSDRYAIDIVTFLLDNGISVQAEDKLTWTPNSMAAWHHTNSNVIILKLIERCTDINRKYLHNETLLQTVMEHYRPSSEWGNESHLKILRALVAKGANVNETWTWGPTALRYAIEKRNMCVIEFLRGNGADFHVISRSGQSLLHFLANRGDQKIIDEDEEVSLFNLLVSEGCQVNAKGANGLTPLHSAASNDNTVIARKLIEHGAGVNNKTNDGMTPLHMAIISANLRMVELLRGNGADLKTTTTEDGKSLIYLVLKSREFMTIDEESRVKLIDLIASEDCQVLHTKDETGESLIHLAAEHTEVAIVRLLIELGVDINSRNDKMETPLHLATKNVNGVAIIELLLEYGADINVKNVKNETPFHTIANALKRDHPDFEDLRMLWQSNARYRFDLPFKLLNVPAPSLRCQVCSNLRYKNTQDPREKVKDDVVTLLMKHSIKLKIADMKLDQGIDYWLEQSSMRDKIEEFREKCLREIEVLKSTYVDDRTSLYTLLHTNLNGRRAYIYNEKLQQLVQSPKLEEEFPQYSVLILASYRETIARKELVERAEGTWLKITEIDFPDIFIERIFAYLTNSDLYRIISQN